MRAFTFLLPFLLAIPASAQKARPTPKMVEGDKAVKIDWDGEWSLYASQSDKIDEQIETHLQDQNFAMKLYWKKKLQSACHSFSKLDILSGDSFSVTMGKERPIDTPADGTETDWKRSDDEKFKATLTRNGPTMIQTLTGDGFTLKYVYPMRRDGNSLALQVTYTHPKLDNPFTYKLVFKRND
jgi:hypothetical protein